MEGKIKKDAAFADELRSSPEKINVGNNNLVLTTFLWRDFMPVAEKNGSPLYCINKLTDTDSTTISNDIFLKKQYVIKDNEIWTAEYSEIKESPEFILEGFIKNGPKWGPGITVDIICEFEIQGVTYRILAKSQLIIATS